MYQTKNIQQEIHKIRDNSP